MNYQADDEADFEDDEEEEDEDGYIPCPHCGETMLEAADYCPACERWMTSEDTPPKRRPWWIVAVILILIATFVLSVLPG